MSNELRSIQLAHQQFRSCVDYARAYAECIRGRAFCAGQNKRNGSPEAGSGTISRNRRAMFFQFADMPPTTVIISYYCPRRRKRVSTRDEPHTQRGRILRFPSDFVAIAPNSFGFGKRIRRFFAPLYITQVLHIRDLKEAKENKLKYSIR